MKKYLQACEMSGSIYGHALDRVSGSEQKRKKRKTDFIQDYTELYKKQAALMGRLFRRSG